MKRFLVLVCVCSLVICVGCKGKERKIEEDVKKDEVVEPKVKEEAKVKEWKAPEKADVDVDKKYVATIKTEKGDIVCELYAKDAPLSVTNFKYLADNDFYKGLAFHRVVPDFVIQGGDPEGTGAGGPGYTIPAEIKNLHTEGALAWARTGDQVNHERRSSGSQFYITYKPTSFLDDQYTVFGQTVKGMDVVNKIQQGDKIVDVIVNVE